MQGLYNNYLSPGFPTHNYEVRDRHNESLQQDGSAQHSGSINDTRQQDESLRNTSDLKVNSPNKSSQQVLKRVFDEDFVAGGDEVRSSYSPQRAQAATTVYAHFANREAGANGGGNAKQQQAAGAGDAMNTIAFNLSKINISDTSQQVINQNEIQHGGRREVSAAAAAAAAAGGGGGGSAAAPEAHTQGLENNLQFFDSCYKAFLSKIASDQSFVNASYENKIALLIDFFSSPHMDYRIGSLIFLFELIYNFRESLTEQAISLILSQIYVNIPHAYENRDFYNVYCSLEIIALIGPHPISYNNIKLLASILIDDALPLLQQKAFLALVNFDYPGFYALLDIANKDFNEVPVFVMNELARTEEIQLSVIVPSLLNDIATGDAKKRVQSLAALNRMHSLIWKGGALPLLIQLLNEGQIDRQLIVSAIRACGEIGEQALLKILRQTNNSKIKLAIATVLSWRVPKNCKSQTALRVAIVPYQVALHYNVNPGTMCVYKGDLTPLAFVEQPAYSSPGTNRNPEQDNAEDAGKAARDSDQIANSQSTSSSNDYVEVNSRDFMAALQRLLVVKYEKFQNSADGLTKQHDLSSFLHDFTLATLIDPSLATQQEDLSISPHVIRSLCALLSDQNVQVREAAINTLGIIGLPEAADASEQLFTSLSDRESSIRAMAAWCCGRLADKTPQKIAKKLIEMLKDPYWKVRTAACVAVGAIGPSLSELAFGPLTRILRDNSINKLTVCESLVRLGIYGEQILIDLLKNVAHANFKLKTAIIQSFQLANVTRPTIDFIIEELFKNASDQMIQVRKACLQTLEILRFRAQDSNITYLKSRNIVPLFYYFLQDSSAEIREMAMLSIRSFGPQAELIFIEGLTKDRNPLIRCECARGLASLGVQNFRALLFGLRDIEENVRKTTAQVIRNTFTLEEIVEEYRGKQNQVPALLCNIKDILSLQFVLNDRTAQILRDVVYAFGENIPNEPHHVQSYQQQQQQQHQQQQRVQEHQYHSQSVNHSYQQNNSAGAQRPDYINIGARHGSFQHHQPQQFSLQLQQTVKQRPSRRESEVQAVQNTQNSQNYSP